MNTRNQIVGTYAIKVTIALLVLTAGSFLYLRFDASMNREHSLRRVTREQLRSLNDPVTVTVFASRDLPQQLSPINRKLKDLLSEFQRLSRGKLRFQYARAGSNAELIEKARQFNIPPFTIVMMENEREVTKEVVLGASFESAGKSSSMFLRPGMETMMEYQIFKQINKLRVDRLPEITVFADSTAIYYQYMNNQDALATFFLELTENYRVNFSDLQSQPKFTPVMLCLGVVDSLDTRQLYHLDQYLMRGGKLILAQDRVAVISNERGVAIVGIESNLFDLLEHYGIRIEPNIVLDAECEKGQGGLGVKVPYTFWPLVRPNPEYPLTQGHGDIYFNIASQLSLIPGSPLKQAKVLQTSANSNLLMGPYFQIDTALQRGTDPEFLSLPPVTVAAEYTGRLTSYFSASPDTTAHLTANPKGSILVFGDSELPYDFGGGAFIILNAIDHYLGRPDLIKLRSSSTTESRLGTREYLKKNKLDLADPLPMSRRLTVIFQLTAIVLPLLLLGILGTVNASRARAMQSMISVSWEPDNPLPHQVASATEDQPEGGIETTKEHTPHEEG